MSNNPLIEAMVDDFLRWPLPASVCSDLCVAQHGVKGRIGTNLMTAVEARQMFEAVVLPKLCLQPQPVVAPRSAEAQFIDQDIFTAYVINSVNPERVKQGLQTVTEGSARHLYDVLTSGRYR